MWVCPYICGMCVVDEAMLLLEEDGHCDLCPEE